MPESLMRERVAERIAAAISDTAPDEDALTAGRAAADDILALLRRAASADILALLRGTPSADSERLDSLIQRLFAATMVTIEEPVDASKVEDEDCEWVESEVCGFCIRAMDDHAPGCEIGKLAAEYSALAGTPEASDA